MADMATENGKYVFDDGNLGATTNTTRDGARPATAHNVKKGGIGARLGERAELVSGVVLTLLNISLAVNAATGGHLL